MEVDYAGEPIEWMDLKSGEVRKAWVFVAGLGFSPATISNRLHVWAVLGAAP